MSRMPESRKGRRPRRQLDEELRSQAVRLVLDGGKTVGAVARDLDSDAIGSTAVGFDKPAAQQPAAQATSPSAISAPRIAESLRTFRENRELAERNGLS